MWKLSCEALPDIVTFVKGPSSKEPNGSLFDDLYEKYDSGPDVSDLEADIIMNFDVNLEIINEVNGIVIERMFLTNIGIITAVDALLHITRALKFVEILNNEKSRSNISVP